MVCISENLKKYISISFQIEWNMGTVFLTIKDPNEIPFDSKSKENCHLDHSIQKEMVIYFYEF